MSQTDRQLSLKTYQYLCNIIGTEEVVKTRRTIFCVLDSVLRISNVTVISSGSKAEGLDLKGSDYDQMFVLKYFQVYENTSKMSSLSNKKLIIMDTSDTKPGFTKLKMYYIPHIYLRHINQITTLGNGETYFSSKLIREHNLPNGMIIQGPCQSTQDENYDMARCFRCNEWITSAHQWVLRSRSSWPDHRLVILSEQTYFQKVSEAVGFLLRCKHLVIRILMFTKPYYLLPVELIPLIPLNVNVTNNRCVIPSVVYLNMLSFLCLYHLGDDRGKLDALRNLELTIRKKYFIVPNEKNFQSSNICLQIAKSMM
ncbi:unnamed protein product [Mytilus coruscus]|uniref:Mab-21-like nucleotidyltransferase domain-containing protein n=1 Tax=Mytilus coruscus TaxID=42192 RepID=A0A6J8B816_MYTCO|nr:unnamed protein product [Mytilus coruscus]